MRGPPAFHRSGVSRSRRGNLFWPGTTGSSLSHVTRLAVSGPFACGGGVHCAPLPWPCAHGIHGRVYVSDSTAEKYVSLLSPRRCTACFAYGHQISPAPTCRQDVSIGYRRGISQILCAGSFRQASLLVYTRLVFDLFMGKARGDAWARVAGPALAKPRRMSCQ